jgi:hypothetical protein
MKNFLQTVQAEPLLFLFIGVALLGFTLYGIWKDDGRHFGWMVVIGLILSLMTSCTPYKW